MQENKKEASDGKKMEMFDFGMDRADPIQGKVWLGFVDGGRESRQVSDQKNLEKFVWGWVNLLEIRKRNLCGVGGGNMEFANKSNLAFLEMKVCIDESIKGFDDVATYHICFGNKKQCGRIQNFEFLKLNLGLCILAPKFPHAFIFVGSLTVN